MTAATYATNLSNIYTGAGSTTNWTALGGGASGLNAETDYFIEGTGCTSKNAFASATKGMIYNHGSDAGGSGTDGAYVCWITHLTPNSLDTIAGGGLQFIIGSSTSDYVHYYVGGSDTIEFGGWVFAAVNEATAGDQADTGTPSSTVEQYFGALYDLPSGGPTKGAPNAIDGIRFGRCDIVVEFGTGADPEADFDGIITSLETATNRYGMLSTRDGAFFNSGLLQLGSSTNAVEFLDSNKTIFIRDHPHVTANFNTWEVQNASSVITLTNLVVKALGTQSPGRWVTTDNATVTLTGCSFIDMGAFGFLSNATADACTFQNCGRIDLGGSDISGSSILESGVAADEGAVFDDRTTTAATDLTEYTGCKFSKGTNAHHAIRFGINVNDDITLTNVDFSGFGTTADANDSTFRFDATTGTMNLNLVNCTVAGAAASSSNISIDDAAGITVTLVIDPVTTKFTVEDVNGTAIENARVLVETADAGGAGAFPFEEAVTTLTQSAGTATLTASAVHGLATGDYVVVRGAQPDGYNKVAQITVTSTTVFTYTVPSGLSSPATGTPIFSYAPIGGLLTNASGIVSSSKTWPATQGIVGYARKKNTVSPFYKDGDISIADASTGTDSLVVLQPDE
jgi:hypothetical protein